MAKIKVADKGMAYFSDDLREAGYVGELNATVDACVLVIPRPGVEEDLVADSLQIMAQDYRLRARLRQRR